MYTQGPQKTRMHGLISIYNVRVLDRPVYHAEVFFFFMYAVHAHDWMQLKTAQAARLENALIKAAFMLQLTRISRNYSGGRGGELTFCNRGDSAIALYRRAQIIILHQHAVQNEENHLEYQQKGRKQHLLHSRQNLSHSSLSISGPLHAKKKEKSLDHALARHEGQGCT